MIVFDANVLIALVSQKTSADDRARLQGLVEEVVSRKSYVGVPTPALAEFLIRSDDATAAVLAALERKSAIRVLPFDRRAAMECALLERSERAKHGKKRGASDGAPYQKIKVDRQIVAIAMANNAERLLTLDGDIKKISYSTGVLVSAIADLPLPDWAKQRPLDLQH